MAVISVTDYKALITDYQTALAQIVGVSDNYFNAASKVLLLDSFNPELDLLSPFYNAYLTALVSYAAQPQSVVNAVRSLQNHILSQGRDNDTALQFTTVNDYYADNPASFSTTPGLEFFTAEFAALSQQAGHAIDDTYVQA